VNCRKLFSLLFAAILVLSLLPTLGLAHDKDAPQVSDKIDKELADLLSVNGSADLVVTMAEQADLSPAYQIGDWNARGQYVYDTLRAVAERSQANAKDYLDKLGLRYESFFAGNELYVYAGDLNIASALADLPEVALIRPSRTYYIDPIINNDPAPAATVDWGIIDTKADQFWAQFGYKGEGIIVANIDTGVQWDHPALVSQFKCGNDPTNPDCWRDPSNVCAGGSMCDNNGHGTHTMGTMVAKDDPSLTYIAGMAPNAQWIACKGCESSSCSDTALNTCADWIVAPDGDPANRPHIVNNSWGGGGGDAWYQAKVQAWVAAGIFPAFSAGNSTGCGSLGSPGDYQESFGTTGHNSSRAHVYAQGPSDFGHDPYTKPNISAPASSVCSSVPTDSWSCSYSGTSMASPHSAGAVALLWSCNPSLVGQIDATFDALQSTADAPDPANPTCGVPPDGQGTYEDGYGYLNVLQAGIYNCVAGWGAINGHVYNAVTSAPIDAATVTGYRDGGGSWAGDTNPTGYYSITVGAGTYTVEAVHPQYSTGSVSGLDVLTDTVVTQDFYLQPRGHLYGYVTDQDSGAPLAATVSVAGGPSTATNPADGYYEFYLDAGSYDVTASAPDYADETASISLAVGGQVQHDFSLLAAIAVVPDPIQISLEMGQTGTVGSQMTNNMAVPYPFEFREFELGAAAQGSGGPDPFGYTYQDSNEPGGPLYEWIDATDGTALGLADDGEANVTLPFAFTFYGTSSTDIRVGNNGGFFFNATAGDLSTANADLGTTTASNLVVPFWDDIDSDTGDVYYKTVGTAPARLFIVEWYDRPHYSNIGSATFELILYEGTNNIKYQYLDTNFGNALYDYGVSATSGIRQTGSNYLQYSYNQAVLVDGLSICFQYPGSPPCDGGDVPWFGTSITGGTVPAGGSLAWTNAFSATMAAGIGQPGVYSARLGIYPTGAGLPSKQISVVMTVLPSTSFGRLQGTVTGDRPGGPLEADVLIEATDGTTVTLTTDPATGAYGYWLEAGWYDVTASAPDYVPETVTVQVTGLATTTQDFELALNAPEIVVTPPSLQKTLVFGQADTSSLNIANDGLQPLDWEIIEMPSGLAVQGSGGPDPFGYTYVDSNEAGGATYEWIDATDGTPLNLTDDSEANVTLPFAFTFYGTSSTDIRVGNNGGFIFNVTTGDLSNVNAALATATASNIVVPFWDDIDADTGNVYYKTIGTAPDRMFVVEWFNRPHFSNVGSATFELILYEGTNNIKYQYLDTNFGNALYDYGVSATSGIRQTGTNYLQYSYNTAVLVDGLAICFQYPGSPPCDGGDVPWLAENPTSGTVPVDGNVDVVVTFDAGAVVEPGLYTAKLLVNNNDPLNGMVQVPVTMTVLPTGNLGKLQGTVSSDRPGGPLEADILIESSGGVTWTTTSDPDTGYYYRWLDAGTYNVTASAGGYVPETVQVQITGQQTTTQDFQLALLAPEIVVTPPLLEQMLELGQTADQALTIANDGLLPLDYEIREQNGGFIPVGLQANTILLMGDDLAAADWDTYRTALAAAGVAWDEWDLLTQPFPTAAELAVYETLIWTDDNTLDPGDADCQVVADWLVSGNKSLFGLGRDFIWDLANGTPGAGEYNLYLLLNTTYVGDYAGTTILTLDGVAGDPIGGDFVSPNGLTLAGTLDSNGDYANTSSTATTGLIYGPGGTGSGSAGLTHYDAGTFKTVWLGVNFHDGLTDQDQRNLLMENSLAFLVGLDVPWLSEEPITGTVPAGGSVPVLVSFDSGVVAEPGIYLAKLNIQSNDPFNSPVRVPVTMTVTPGANLGKLDGIVTGMGYCDEESYPLEASLVIEASDGVTRTVATDPASGYYYRWLNAGTYTVTVSAPEHVDGAAVVQITGQQTTTQDFALRYIESCMNVTPTSFSLTLPVDTQLTEQLTIGNSGAGELSWELHETTRTVGIVSIPAFKGTLPDTGPVSFERAPASTPAAAAAGQSVLNPGLPGYGMNLSSDSLYRWPDVDVPGTWNLVGTPGVTSAYAGDFGADLETLYLISDDTQVLYAVDPATGAATAIGPCPPVAGQTWTGMAWDPTTQTMYGSATDGATATLFTINLATGATTQVATISGAPYTIDIAADGSGQMYGVDISLDSLLLIDKATGATTVVGSIGFTANYAQGLDYDLDSDILYMAAYNYNGVSGQGEMRIVDTSTGNTTLLGTMPGGAEVDALAIEAGGVPPWNDIPWVTEVPTNGVTGPDSLFDVDVTFDTTGLTVGECYTGSLGLVHDDPGWVSPTYIPLTLCVSEACEEVVSVALSVVTPGPFYPGATVQFSADIAPDGFTGPYSYSINGGPVQVSSDDPLLFSLSFGDPGSYSVEIAVWNCDMSAPATDTVEITISPYTTYLPVILRNY
jgi:Subtilase family/Carboxypeptidase regulatory-like domain/Domain of unknown function (DUF4394)